MTNMENSSLHSDVDVENMDATRKWYKIEHEMISAKLTFYFENAKRSSMTPNMILFLTSIGLDITTAGLVNGIRYIGYIVGPPFFGLIADRTNAHKTIFLCLCIFAVLFNSLLPLLSLQFGNDNVNKCPVPRTNLFSTRMNTTNSSANDSRMSDVNSFNQNILFVIVIIVSILANIFDGSTMSFADAGVMQRINVSRRKHIFGRQRLFGAIGFGSGAIFAGLAVQFFPSISITCYSAIFIIYFACNIFLAFSVCKLFKGLSFEKSDKKEKDPKIKQLLWRTFKHFSILAHFATVLYIGTIRGLFISFLFKRLKELQASNILMGLSLATGSISSIVAFFFSANLMRKLGGTLNAIAFSTLAWSIRFILVAYLVNPWYIIPMQLINGLCIGLFISAATEHVKIVSLPAIWSTMLGLTYCLYSGCGMVLANVVGGALYGKFGGKNLFLAIGTCSFVWFLLLVIYIILNNCLKKKKNSGTEMKDLFQMDD